MKERLQPTHQRPLARIFEGYVCNDYHTLGTSSRFACVVYHLLTSCAAVPYVGAVIEEWQEKAARRKKKEAADI